MKKVMEMQGPDINPEDLADEIYVRDASGNLVKLEVADDADDN